MITDDLCTGWTLRLAPDSPLDAVPASVQAALPIPAQVPGTVHLDLLRERLIADPYLDRNELSQDWIGRHGWCYERELDIPPELIGSGVTEIEFDGLDTVAQILVNGIEVARTENMHRRYRVGVGHALRPGRNVLSVVFSSAWAYAEEYRQRHGALPNQYPSPFAYIRKNSSNFGWDWGPSLVTAGIWREVRLIHHDGVRLDRVRPAVDLHGPDGVVDLVVDIAGAAPAGSRVVAEVAGVSAEAEVNGADPVALRLQVENPRLWWPVGLGEQTRYVLNVSLGGPDGPLDTWSARIGFRSVRLNTAEDENGSAFTIEVNGAPIPVRGANWIPDDCFLPRVDEARLRQRLGQAVGAEMNLLRVWGGGVYESEMFYDLCDELGLMVWQDFLFACAGYPEDEPLAAQVEAEARDNVVRLMPHPSLVLWNGNNENIWGWFDWNWQPLLDGRDWGLGYYLDVLPQVVAELDPSRPYWAGSPYSGSMQVHANDENHGCTHVWDVWNEKDYSVYREHRPRFVSEFGWQGPPAWSTLTRAVRDEPLTPTSPGVLHHQKAEDGNGKLERGLEPHLPVPVDIADWHFAMQLNQARAIAYGVAHFRSLRPHNQGVIVWQLNDCWPATSWAAIDGDGRRKPLWYALRQAYRPRLLTIQPDGEALTVIGVNDAGSTWRESVTVVRYDLDGTERARYSTRLAADRFGAARVRIPDEVARPERPEAEVLIATTQTGARTEYFFVEDKDLDLTPAVFEHAITRDGEDVVVTLTAETFVRDLCLFPDRLAPAAEADQALLTLLPGERAVIRVSGLPAGADAELLQPPVLRTVNDLICPSAASTAIS